jgi:hypothetical protein
MAIDTSFATTTLRPPGVLSKSKLLAFRQCPKRLWLQIHRPELEETSSATSASFGVGHQVGAIARRLYDPQGTGVVIDPQADGGVAAAVARTQTLLSRSVPIFEAGFEAGGARAFADVLLPVRKRGNTAWRMVEVKSATSVKAYYREDAAIQATVARAAGLALDSIAVAHVDSSWVYPGGGDYRGLFVEEDVTEDAFGAAATVGTWVEEALAVVRLAQEPHRETGAHCSSPYACGFSDYCRSQEPQAEYPVTWLPRIQTKALKAAIARDAIIDLRHAPDELLNARQLRVKTHTLSGQVYFGAKQAAKALTVHKPPAYFLDFESIRFAVPIWKGTRPYQQLPFQFSVHRLTRAGKLESESFLDLSGEDPRRALAGSLIRACGTQGPVFVYSSFEAKRIRELAKQYPKLKPALLALCGRLVDLLPIAEEHYYHPSQQGSWSLKKLLPAVAPDLCYDTLPGVKDGDMAMAAYAQAIAPGTAPERREEIRQELIAYCGLDTLAMVRVWEFLAGRPRTEP